MSKLENATRVDHLNKRFETEHHYKKIFKAQWVGFYGFELRVNLKSECIPHINRKDMSDHHCVEGSESRIFGNQFEIVRSTGIICLELPNFLCQCQHLIRQLLTANTWQNNISTRLAAVVGVRGVVCKCLGIHRLHSFVFHQYSGEWWTL